MKGRVTDESGAPVIGATVILKGTTTGTATNAAGEYAIDIRQADAVLVFSLIGYNKVEVALSEGQTQADVTLKSEAIAMDNVVVVGYGVQNKRDVTTAISSIKAEDFAAMPTADFRDAMAAKMPGVQVLTLGGQPDGNVSIRIRGIQSATSGNDPLYVIDGVPCDCPGLLEPRKQRHRKPRSAQRRLGGGDLRFARFMRCHSHHDQARRRRTPRRELRRPVQRLERFEDDRHARRL